MKLFNFKVRFTFLAAAAALTVSESDLAAQSTWTGSTDPFWSTGANWSGTIPSNGGSGALVFNAASLSGASLLSTENDLSGFTATSITFNNSTLAGSYILAGNQITLGGNIETIGTVGIPAHVISLGLILNGNRTVTTVADNSLSISGIIGETGGSRNLVKAGTGLLRLEGANTFSGQVQINAGSIVFTQVADTGVASSLGTGLGTSIIRVGTGNAGATLRYEGSGGSTNRQIQIGSGSLAGAGGAIVSNFGTGAITYTAPSFNAAQAGVTVARTLTLGGTDVSGSAITGIIVDNSPGTGGVINLAKADAGTWTLSGANTFSGQVQINAGTLVVSDIADIGTASHLGTGAANSVVRIGNANVGGTLRIEGGGGSTNRQVQIGNGTSANHAGGTNIDHFATGEVTFSAPVFNAAQTGAIVTRNLVLGGDGSGGGFITGAIVDNNTAGGGVVNVVKADGGLWKLSGENTFTGRVTVQAGTLEVTKFSDLGTAGSLGTGAGDSTIRLGTNTTDATLSYSGDADSATNRDFLLLRNATITNIGIGAVAFTAGVFNQSHATAAARTLTLNGSQTGSNTISGLIQDNNPGTLGLTKSGLGVWQLTHTGSTYSGQTVVNQGTLRVAHLADGGSASSLGTGNLNPVIRIGNGSNTATLSYLGSGSTTNRQIQIGSAINQGGGAVVESVGTGALVFSNPVFNVQTATTSGRLLTLAGGNTDANEIQGTIQNNDTGAVSLLKKGAGFWILSGSNTFSGATTVEEGTLRVATGSNLANQAVTIRQGTLDLRNVTQAVTSLALGHASANGSARLQIAAGGILVTSGNLTTIANSGGHQAIVEGSGTIDLLQAAGTRTWTVADTPGLDVDLLVSASLNASATSGNRVFNKAGEGVLELAGSNAFENLPILRISGGGLRLGETGTLSGAVTADIRQGFLELRNTGQSLAGVILGNATVGNGASELRLGPAVALALAGNITYSADDDTANSAAISGGELSLTGNRAVTVGDNPAITGPELIIASPISESGGARSLTKAGEGSLRLDGVSTYTGGTIITGGILQLGTDQAIPATGAVSVNGGAAGGTLDLNGRTLTVASLGLGGTITTVAGIEQRVVDRAGGGVLTLAGNVTYNTGSVGFENGRAHISASLDLGSAGRVITVGDSPNAATDVLISGVVAGGQGLTKAGAGTLYLGAENTFTGQIAVNGGTLQANHLADLGTVSSIGTGTVSGVIRIGNQAVGGTLEYLGQGDATNRSIQIGAGTAIGHTGGATILNNGTGALEFTNASFNTAVNTGAGTPGEGRVVTFGGANTDANRVAGVIRNNAQSLNPIVSVVKQDTGLWIFEGNNTYSGTTTIEGGTLRIDGNQVAATGAVFVNNGGILTGDGVVGGETTLRNGGSLSAGTVGGTGSLDFSGNLVSESGSLWLVDLVGDLNQTSDLIQVAGSLHLGGAGLQLNQLGNFAAGNTYVIAQYGGNLTGTFAGLADGDVIGGQYVIGYGSGANGVITLTAVPEPPVILSLAIAMLVSLLQWRRRKGRVQIPA